MNRKCKWCGEVKPLPKRKRICDECKQQQFFKSKYWIWLESAVMKCGIQCLPDDTDGLIALLELKKQTGKWSGWYRINGELDCMYKYELAHRYPASDGGKLIADNLVIMPMVFNRKMGNRHGRGLECYRSDKVERMPRKEVRREFLRRYDIAKLEGFAKLANDNGSDFETDGMDVMGVMNVEAERLGYVYTPTEKMDFIQEFFIMTEQYSAMCGCEKVMSMTVDINEALATLSSENQDKMMSDVLSPDLEWMGEGELEAVEIVRELVALTESEIVAMDAKSFRADLEDADNLSPLIDEQRTIYRLLQDERKQRNKCMENGDDR